MVVVIKIMSMLPLLIILIKMVKNFVICNKFFFFIVNYLLRFYPNTDCFIIEKNQFNIYLKNGECKIYYLIS